MKDNAIKRHKQKRSASPVYSISDDENPKRRKVQKVDKHHESRHSHRKPHRNHRHHSSESLSDNEENNHHRGHRHRNRDEPVRIKEEPVTDDERERKLKRHKHTEYSRHSASRNKRSSRPVKEEEQNDKEPEWGKKEIKTEKKDGKSNAKPDFGLSGKLTEDTNTFNGVVIKYSEPPEARKPKRRWRLYPFKGEKNLPVLHIHRQSAYLLGRDRKVADIPIDHPSCSKQHAALQYRLVSFNRADGTNVRQIKLYVIDLESANGTFLNNNKIEPKRYYELKEKDVVKFGFSLREYVLLHEHSKDSENDDDVQNDV